MKIYVVMVTHSCTISIHDEDVCLNEDCIIDTTTNKEKAIKIANEYVDWTRKDILKNYNGELPDGYKFNDIDDIGDMYIDWSRRIYDMELKRSMFDYQEWSTIEIKVYDD